MRFIVSILFTIIAGSSDFQALVSELGIVPTMNQHSLPVVSRDEIEEIDTLYTQRLQARNDRELLQTNRDNFVSYFSYMPADRRSSLLAVYGNRIQLKPLEEELAIKQATLELTWSQWQPIIDLIDETGNALKQAVTYDPRKLSFMPLTEFEALKGRIGNLFTAVRNSGQGHDQIRKGIYALAQTCNLKLVHALFFNQGRRVREALVAASNDFQQRQAEFLRRIDIDQRTIV